MYVHYTATYIATITSIFSKVHYDLPYESFQISCYIHIYICIKLTLCAAMIYPP